MKLFTNILFLFAFALFYSCAKRPEGEEKLPRVPFRKEDEIVAALDSISSKRPQTFFSKIKVSYSDTNRNIKIRTTINYVRDSAMTAVISYANIPIVSALITPDSVFVSNKKDKCYTKSNVDFLKETFSIDFSFKNLEELFLGLPIDFNENIKYEKFNDLHYYIVSSHKKREIRKENRGRILKDRDGNLKRNLQDSLERDIIYKYYLGKDMKSLRRIFINSIDDTTTINIVYLGRDTIQGYLIPSQAEMTIKTPRNEITILMTYKETEVDNPLKLVFRIPENYVDCSLKGTNNSEDENPESEEPSIPEEAVPVEEEQKTEEHHE